MNEGIWAAAEKAERASIKSLGEKIVASIQSGFNAEQCAKAVYEVLKAQAVAEGQQEREVMIRAPGEPRHFSDQGCWVVAWEAGPFEWAIPVSMMLCSKVLAEPYYSFDLCFYPNEDPAK